MSGLWRSAVCAPGSAVKVLDPGSYSGTANLPYDAPIDLFYLRMEELIKMAQQASLNQHKYLAGLILIGMVSATETYFREIFSRILTFCPIAKTKSADAMISLGSVIWAGGSSLDRVVFEHQSFSDSKEIRRAFEKYLAYQVKENSPVFAALENFDQICEIRHCCVHASGMIVGKNGLKFGISSSRLPLQVELDVNRVQECASICYSLIRAVNLELFHEMSKRWKKDWRNKISSWDRRTENKLFNDLWSVFYSVTDASRNEIPVTMTRSMCKRTIVAEIV